MEDRIGFALRGAKGIEVYKGVSNPEIVYKFDVAELANDIRVMQYSNNGKYLAYCNSIETILIDTETGEELFKHPLNKPTVIVFSPKDTYFVSWEMYCVYGRRKSPGGTLRVPNPNIHFFSVGEKKHLKTIIGKQKEQIPQWTYDEKYMLRIDGSEVLAFEDNNWEKSKFKGVIYGIKAIAVSTHQKDHFFAAFVPADVKTGQPALVELRRINKEMTSFCTAQFMNCDKINMLWNSKGTTLLALATVEVDNTGKSYYGKSYLQVLSFNGEKTRVNFDKEGSIHDLKWNPTGNHFAVCYGYMPSKVAIFNQVGNVVWDLGDGHRNEVHFNLYGNLLITCGFGSLTAGKIQIWNFDEEKEINTIEVENTTQLEFSGDGQHFYTATTAPRMRVDNRYRLWKYTGEMLFEYAPTTKYELWQVMWKPIPEAAHMKFNVVELSKEEKSKTGLKFKVANGTAEIAAGAVKKPGAYVPPHARKGGSNSGALQPAGAGVTAATNQNEKQIKKLEGVLNQINKIKEKKQKGEKLEKNQLEKLDREAAILEELEKLKA